MLNEKQPSDLKTKLYLKITRNEVDDEFKLLLSQIEDINFVDEYGISPLQHACFIGSKDSADLLIAKGADVNFCQNASNYTSLHFAALSGNIDVVLKLLELGAVPNTLNAVSRTPAQMAAFVGNHNCSAIINNYVSKSEVEYFTVLQGDQTEPYLPGMLLEKFHKLVTQINIHPVRIALNLQKFECCTEELKKVRKVLEMMTEREMAKGGESNETIAFKFHYFSWIVSELIKCQESQQSESVEFFSKRILKKNKSGQLDFLEFTIRECVREFPYRDCTIFRHVVNQLASKDCPPALDVLKSALNGPNRNASIPSCSSCGEEKPDKKCSKCKEVQYCDRECQRLHWFMHKKTCARPTSTTASLNSTINQRHKGEIDASEISEQLQSLVAR